MSLSKAATAQWVAGAFCVVASTLAADRLVGAVPWLREIELAWMHQRSLASNPLVREDDVVVVAVNDLARSELGVSQNIELRPLYARLLETTAHVAKTVLFDLEFRGTGPEADAALVRAIDNAAPEVVLIASHIARENRDASGGIAFAKPDFADRIENPRVCYGIAWPLEVGGRMRGIVTQLTDYLGTTWHHAVVIASRMDHQQDALWIRLPAPNRTTPVVPLHEALDGKGPGLAGKVVVVGETSADQIMGPEGRTSGTELNALAVRSLIQAEDAVPWLPPHLGWVLAGVFAALAAFASLRDRRAHRLALGAVAMSLAVAAPNLMGWLHVAIVPTLTPLAACLLSFALVSTTSHLVVPSKTSNEATIVFIDLVNFTPLTLELGDEGIRDLMARFHRRIGSVFESHGGKIERTLGDAILIRFEHSDPAERVGKALAACRKARKEATGLLRSRSLSVTIGMEDGPIAGQLVETKRHEEWSSFGAAVNMAARLQALCGKEAIPIAIGPSAAAHVAQEEGLRVWRSVFLKGFDDEVRVYTVSEDHD